MLYKNFHFCWWLNDRNIFIIFFCITSVDEQKNNGYKLFHYIAFKRHTLSSGRQIIFQLCQPVIAPLRFQYRSDIRMDFFQCYFITVFNVKAFWVYPLNEEAQIGPLLKNSLGENDFCDVGYNDMIYLELWLWMMTYTLGLPTLKYCT